MCDERTLYTASLVNIQHIGKNIEKLLSLCTDNKVCISYFTLLLHTDKLFHDSIGLRQQMFNSLELVTMQMTSGLSKLRGYEYNKIIVYGYNKIIVYEYN